jgi:hypothetical protein
MRLAPNSLNSYGINKFLLFLPFLWITFVCRLVLIENANPLRHFTTKTNDLVLLPVTVVCPYSRMFRAMCMCVID